MSEKFMGVYLDEDKINEFHMLALKERKKLKVLHLEIIEDYIKKHADGNPQYKIDQFDDPNFVACPAVFRDSRAWNHYMKQANPNEMENLKNQIIMIDRTLGKYL